MEKQKPTTISLVHGRYRQIFWGVILLPLSAILIFKFGIGGKILGAFCGGHAISNLVRGGKTFLNPPGTFRIASDTVSIPTALCSGESREFSPRDIRHSYVLRRFTPWNRTAPMLVVESADAVFSYGRDWFESDADVFKVARSLNGAVPAPVSERCGTGYE